MSRNKKPKNKYNPATFVKRSVAKLQKEEAPAAAPPKSLEESLRLREYQLPVFNDHSTGILILHWARQIGKSYVLAAWAVRRLMDRPGRLVTVLSNSRDNGAEFLRKCAEMCREWRGQPVLLDQSLSLHYEAMRMELRIYSGGGKVGRIKVLAANPRTARGFSGDLILDEFAFHEDSAAIWEAAEPILASNADFLCRIASTGNGRHNLFYRMTHGAENFSPDEFRKKNDSSAAAADEQSIPQDKKAHEPVEGDGSLECGDTSPLSHEATCRLVPKRGHVRALQSGSIASPDQSKEKPPPPFPRSIAGFCVSRVPRSLAYTMGAKVYDSATRKEITPAQARERALDKRAYDQNYECFYADESLTLLSHELISAAERDGVGEICEQTWGAGVPARLKEASGLIYVGFDVARNRDLSVITVVEQLEKIFYVRAILRMRDLRLPEQQERLGVICALPKFRRAAIDMTGMGLGLVEYAQKAFGARRIVGINFASSVPATEAIRAEGRKRESVRVTEALALEVLRAYEERRVQQPMDDALREDLRKPERVTSPSGRVSIAATRDEAGHADHFWSLALALEAASEPRPPAAMETFRQEPRSWEHRRLLI